MASIGSEGRRGRFGLLLAALLLAAGLDLPARAQDATLEGLSKDEIARKLEEEKSKLQESQKRQKELQASTRQLAAEREDINRKLVEIADKVQESEAELTRIEARLQELAVQDKLIRDSLEERRDVIATLLAALQRMGRNPPPVMVTRRQDALTQVRSAMLLASVFPELRDQALELAGKLAALEAVVEEARAAAERLVARKNTLAGEQQQLDALLLQKREQIAHNEEDLAEIQQLARLQAKSVADLGELIGKLDKAVAEAPKAKLGEYEQELERGTAPGQNEEPAETFRAQDGTVRLALGNPGRIKPALPFEKSKGLLPLPVQGRKILGFGDPTRYGSRSKGMAYATREGAQIRSPNDGWVVYAGEFRSYGQLLIINAGGGYHVLLAGLEQIYVTVGQFVLTGEPVGKMGSGRRSSDGATGKDDPILYVEFRRKDRPIDPEPWWAKEPQKVAG